MSRVKNSRGQEQRSLVLSQTRVRRKGDFKLYNNFSKLPKQSRSNQYAIYEMIRDKVENEG